MALPVNLPYWRLAGIYACYFALLGVLNPYWGLYLDSIGFTPVQIGQLMGILLATKLIAPNLWSFWADYSGHHIRIMRLGAFLTALSFTGIFWHDGNFWTLAWVMFAFSFFWNAILPQYEVITLVALKGHEAHYSRVRVWGSVGFIMAVLGLGVWLDQAPIQTLPWWLWGLMWALLIFSFTLPKLAAKSQEVSQDEQTSLAQTLKRPQVWVILLCAWAMQASHGPYYTFYSLYLEQEGYSRTWIGSLWALGVGAEVLVFLVMHRLLPALKAEGLLVLSLVLASVRWFALALAPAHLMFLIPIQVLHAATFGCFHASCIALVHTYFPKAQAAQGQALYSSVGFGAGGAVGATLAGWLWQAYPPSWSFLSAAALAAGASLLAWHILLGQTLHSQGIAR
ncbi:MFS transporter, PPP family, 3-phenylpropionic acid transporter [Allopseudospirillum japonicum]|uniref:MFS transporter, PPP family, 3-phenylpropionic acid transporter n=1 Tax=Allopseudospirillum japonicum TaxID=64971 RepID=A0A1H6RYT1_9GAMM|nr:MFS transporter [Allopseudospirillum japonicum]SEI56342.1 MFS transporter, PPP family, 3-phenylpropionic acid transporter [Allopseudospirillum japonicum]